METRIFHGDLTVTEIAKALYANFNRNNLRAQIFGSDKKATVQIASLNKPISGGPTALSVNLEQVEDGVAIQIGKQSWLGVAASLGITALTTLKNPWSLIGRLDDIAVDIGSIQLSDQVWEVIEESAQIAGATYELSERLRRQVCSYCGAANPIGEPTCIACGAPSGKDQLYTCTNCGFVILKSETICPNCGNKIK
jgi:DNA-directed RNA polymerase subunit RPC12/RpoP